MIYKGLVISDIHFGAIPPKNLYYQLNQSFLNTMKKTQDLNLVVINGDLLDHKLSFNSDSSKLAIKFITEIVKIAKKKKIKVRIIKGTKSHDLDQLDNFMYLESESGIDFRIINTVTSEQMFPDLKILYIPEEYMENKEEFYKNYFNEEYDLCFGHGTFNHVSFINKEIESEKPIKNAPIFSFFEIKDMVKGPIIFGHIHQANAYKKKIFYCGSFTRWCFGEEEKKGFRTFVYSTKSNNFKVGFIENKLAPTYKTIDITDLFQNNDKSIEEKIFDIEKIKEEENVDYLRLKIDKSFVPNAGNMAILKKYFSEKDNIKVSISNPILSNDEESNKIEEEYSFIFKKELPISKIISNYLLVHDNINITSEKIDDILHSI